MGIRAKAVSPASDNALSDQSNIPPSAEGIESSSQNGGIGGIRHRIIVPNGLKIGWSDLWTGWSAGFAIPPLAGGIASSPPNGGIGGIRHRIDAPSGVKTGWNDP